MVPGHEIAGIVAETGPGVTAFKVGDRVGVGCMVDSCGQCDACRAGRSSTAPRGTPRRTTRSTAAASPRTAATRRISSCATRSSSRSPRASPSTRPRPCCARASPRTPRSSAGASAPARRWLSSVWAASATWPSRSRTRLAPRSPSSPDAAEEGRRAQARRRPLLRDRRPGDLRGTGRDLRRHPLHGLGPAGLRRLPRPAADRRDPGERRRPGGADLAQPLLAHRRDKAIAGSMIGGIGETQEMLDFCAAHGSARRSR